MPGRKATFIELSPKQEKILMEFKSGTQNVLHLENIYHDKKKSF